MSLDWKLTIPILTFDNIHNMIMALLGVVVILRIMMFSTSYLI